MTAIATRRPTHARVRADRRRPRAVPAQPLGEPIVVAVDGSAADIAAVEAAVGLAARTGAPVVFVYVRRGPAGFLGTPYYQRRLTTAMARARQALDDARRIAAEHGIVAEEEILEGSPRRRILELAAERDARLVIVGRRRRPLGRLVSRAFARSAGQPVVVALPGGRPAVADGRARKDRDAPDTDRRRAA